MQLKTVFLDRDGVVNKDVGYVHKIKDFQFIDSLLESCHLLNSKGYEIIIVTNQSGIGRGFYTLSEFNELNDWMISKFNDYGVKILDVYFCPHAPDDDCNCRKPKTGMFDKAFSNYKIDKKNSWMIGDREDDITAARNAGIQNTVLVRSGHKFNEKTTSANFIIDSIKDINRLIV